MGYCSTTYGQRLCYQGDKMDILYEATRQFERDLEHIRDKKSIIKNLNKLCYCLKTDDTDPFYKSLVKPAAIKLKDDLIATLYILRINQDFRIILSVDEDPLFNQVVITLYCIVRPNNYKKAFADIGKKLYQEMLVEENNCG